MIKRTIHDESVSYSQTLPEPKPGEGKHYKAPTKSQKIRRNSYMLKMYIREGIAYLNKCDPLEKAKLHMAREYGKSVRE